MIPKFDYGDIVRDTLTDVVGVVTARCDYYGRDTTLYRVEYKASNGLNQDWIAEDRLETAR